MTGALRVLDYEKRGEGGRCLKVLPKFESSAEMPFLCAQRLETQGHPRLWWWCVAARTNATTRHQIDDRRAVGILLRKESLVLEAVYASLLPLQATRQERVAAQKKSG